MYRMGEFCVTVNIFRSLRENTADTKDFRRQSTIPMISVPGFRSERTGSQNIKVRASTIDS